MKQLQQAILTLLLVWGVYSQAIYNQFGYGWQGNTANAIAWAESGQNAYAANWVYPDASIGLFQINLYAHAWAIPGSTWNEKAQWLENPYNNIWYAHQLYLDAGFYPWSTYTNGMYWRYL